MVGALVTGWIDALVDVAAQLLGALSGGFGGPTRIGTDGVAALPAGEPVIDEERLTAAWIATDAEPRGFGVVVPPHRFAGQLGDELVAESDGFLGFLPGLRFTNRCSRMFRNAHF
jgi:hypothetical protein